MRAIMILLSTLFLTGCIVSNSIIFKEESAKGKPDLVINGDFDEALANQNDYIAPWFIMADNRNIEVLEIDSNTSSSGNNSLKILPSGQRKLIVSESFEIDNLGGYFISGYLKSTDKNKATVIMEFRSYDRKGKLKDKFSMPIVPGDSWENVNISAGLFKSTVRYGRIIFIIPSYQHEPIWIDNVGCFKVHQFMN
jgi:hypothetical protein